jgi:carboxyl-terminal processing protease
MKKYTRMKIIVVVLSVVIFSLVYANTKTEKNPTETKKGFISNLNELKEVSDIMDIIVTNHVGENETDKKDLMHGAIKGMLQSLGDPYSVYFDKAEMESFKEDIQGKYAGVGMVIQKKENEALVVVSPIEDTPAYEAGIKPKDMIIEIDGESTYNLTSSDCVKKLKGEPGTEVKIKIYRESSKESKDITLTRAIVELKYVKHKVLSNKVGYLRITQFGEDVYPDVKKAMDSLTKQGIEALILDLRSNPGGALDQSIKIASMFVKDGKIVSVKGKTGQEQVYMREGKYYGDFPMVVLINEGSASASEIVSGALKDNKRAILLGEKSFGKGSVQSLIPLPDGDGVKLTIAKYYTPSGISIHGKGIEPDIKVVEDSDYLFFNGFVTNIDEEKTKENRNELIKELKGEEEAEKLEKKVDAQLEMAIGVLKGILLNDK